MPLHYHSKHVTAYREFVHSLNLHSAVTFSPDPTMLWACLTDQVYVIAVVRTSLHESVLKKFLWSNLKEAACNPADRRFYKEAIAKSVEGPVRGLCEQVTSLWPRATCLNEFGMQARCTQREFVCI